MERQIEEGFTKPADQKPRELRFKMLGQVKNVSVKEGDVVKAGQELMALDDADERAEMDILEKDANEIRIEGARISVKVKKAEFERIKGLGVTVQQEPYQPGGGAEDLWLATFEDSDGNYFQIASPMPTG